MADLTHTLERIWLHELRVNESRHRKLNPDLVKTLIKSIKEQGLINPITVQRNGDDGFVLIAGLHRLKAYEAMEREAIPAIILDGIDALDAEACELRENLDRGDLSPAERDLHIAALKLVLEKKHALKPGKPTKGATAPQKAGDKRGNTVKETAAQIHSTPAKVERAATRAGHIERLADVVGTSLDVGVEIDALAKLDSEKQNALIDRAKNGEKVSARTALKQTMRNEKEKALAQKQCALPDKKYGVILSDPEWRFDVWSEEGKSRAAENHYPVSDLQTIKDRDVASIAADDCVLFLWATAPMLPEALGVMADWGFTYKSNCIWNKDKTGTGYWFRNKHELLLIGTKGNIPAPAMGTQWPSVIDAPVGKHSEKPEKFHKMIEGYYPSLPRIELNAREGREGWDTWGYEAPE